MSDEQHEARIFVRHAGRLGAGWELSLVAKHKVRVQRDGNKSIGKDMKVAYVGII